MSELKIACPNCGGHISFPPEIHGQIIPCPHCSLSVALQIPGYTTAVAPPPISPLQAKQLTKSKNIGCLAATLILGAAVVLFFVIPAAMFSDHENSQSSNSKAPIDSVDAAIAKAAKDESLDAYLAACEYCKMYAPSGNNFTTQSGEAVTEGHARWVTNSYGIPNWIAVGYLDSQNEFGAMRHQKWFASVVPDGEKWKLMFLKIGDEDFVNHYESP